MEPHPIRVYLIENNTAMRATLRDFLLHQASLELVGATNGSNDQLERLASLKPEVILLDLHMQPRFSLDIIPYLRKQSSEAHIILMTLFDQHAYHDDAVAAGADDLICKSNIITELMPAIERVMRPA